MKKIMIRKSVLFQWLLSYTLILLIPVVCYLFYGRNSNAMIQREIASTNRLVVTNLQENIDLRISEMKSVCQFILKNKKFTQSIQTKQENDVLFRSGVADFLKELNNYVTSLDTDLNVLIYYPEQDLILTHETGNASEFLFTLHKSVCGGTREDWIQALSVPYKNHFMISDLLSMEGPEPHLIYANTPPRNTDIRPCLRLHLRQRDPASRGLSGRQDADHFGQHRSGTLVFRR